jgi:hypothetical protein
MKILIVGLLSLIVLTACTRFHPHIPIRTTAVEDAEKSVVPPGFKKFCEAKDGVMVVFVNKNGDTKARACPGIDLLSSRPDGVDEPVGGPSTLGITQKWRKPNDPDPCIDWVMGGSRYYFCW